MPKNNIPVDQETLDILNAVPADAVFERLNGLLAESEAAEARIEELKAEGKKRFPKGLRAQALEAKHYRRLIERITGDEANRKKLSQVVQAHQMATQAKADEKKNRVRRDRACQVLNVRYKVPKVDLYTKYDIERGKLNKAFNTFNGKVAAWSLARAWREADAAHAVYSKAISVEDTARKFRDDLFSELERPTVWGLNSDPGEAGEAGYTPTDLGRLTGLSPARIIQLRTGSSNRSRARRADEERARKRREAQMALTPEAPEEKIGA